MGTNNKNLIITNILSCEDEVESLVIAYPEELKDEDILKNNISYLPKNVRKLKEGQNNLRKHQEIYNNAQFDVQRASVEKDIDWEEYVIDTAKSNMNYRISPYYWKLIENYEGYISDEFIKADILAILVKGESKI